MLVTGQPAFLGAGFEYRPGNARELAAKALGGPMMIAAPGTLPFFTSSRASSIK
jgi:hypothetical protein